MGHESVPLEGDILWLDQMDMTEVYQGWGRPHINATIENHPLTLSGKVYSRGVGTHAFSRIDIDLKKSVLRFEAIVGLDDETGDLGSVTFEVWVNRKKKLETPVLNSKNRCCPISVNLQGASLLTLLVTDAQDGAEFDHADWVEARFILDPEGEGKPEIIPIALDPVPKIHRKWTASPIFHFPPVIGGTPGRDFLYRLPVSGKRPMKFSCDNLPEGLLLNEDTGIISGKLEKAGDYQVWFTATNEVGSAYSSVKLMVGDRCLALTPPMGWNSWNVWGHSVKEQHIRDAAEGMIESGLADFGYQYINIDDSWAGCRNTDGTIRPNEKFTDMKALGDYIHSHGLRYGIYSSPGPLTCGNREGSYDHEHQDAQTYADWGVDFLKYDWCSYQSLVKNNTLDEYKKPYQLMREALDKTNRDILYASCQYGQGNIWTWAKEVNTQMWRTGGDIDDNWPTLLQIVQKQVGLEKYAGPGAWNDPDMMVLGRIGWGSDMRQTKLNPHEQMVHMTFWAILAAPLILGCDLKAMDPFTFDLLTHEEILAVHQDYPGRQGWQLRATEKEQVWVRPLSDGSFAVGLFNMDIFMRNITITWKDLGLSGALNVWNLWERRDLGTHLDQIQITVPTHGVVFLKIQTH